jgi:hypothetical protein
MLVLVQITGRLDVKGMSHFAQTAANVPNKSHLPVDHFDGDKIVLEYQFHR